MAYQLNVRCDSVGPCRLCGADVATETYERVAQAADVPLWRSVRRRVSCPCGAWHEERVDRATAASFPRTPGIRARIAMSYALLVGMFALAGVQASQYYERRERAHAAAPEVGDRWSLETSAWPGEPVTLDGLTMVRVEAVTAHEVQISACDVTYVEDKKTKCGRYTDERAPVARDRIPSMLAAGVVRDIDRDSDQTVRIAITISVLVAVLLLLALHGDRTRRALAPR